jgi:hypothetical protein
MLLSDRIRGEFCEMPGLSLTIAQAGRLWGLEPDECAALLAMLVDSGFLCRKADGAYGRASDLRARHVRRARVACAKKR